MFAHCPSATPDLAFLLETLPQAPLRPLLLPQTYLVMLSRLSIGPSLGCRLSMYVPLHYCHGTHAVS